MPIQNVIKEKRKEIGLTQEQIADYLGVSTPAVNKWESGATYPDISLLAPLARLLKIDLNTLLCFKEELTKQEIGLFCKEVSDKIKQDGYESGLLLAQKKIEQYPNSYSLIHNLALSLDGAMILTGMNAKDRKKYEVQINALYERIMQSEDADISNSAKFMLASKYINKENFEKAQEMLDLLPEHSSLDKRLLQANLWDKKGESIKAEEMHERLLLMDITQIWNNLLSLIELELKTGNHDNAAKLADICSQSAVLFDLSDYYRIIPLFEVAVGTENEADSISLMESLFASTEKLWSFSESILFRHIPMKEKPENNVIQILPAIINEIESSPKYDFLRKSEKYRSLLERYYK